VPPSWTRRSVHGPEATNVTSDAEIRAATLAHVRRLQEAYAGRIPRAALLEHVAVAGQKLPFWNYQKGIFKPAALGRDGAALSIQTSAASPYDDLHDTDAGTITYKYRGTDALHPDNVALRRAMERQLPLVYLVGVDPGVYDVVAPVYIIGDDPASLEFRLVADQLATTASMVDPIRATVRREYVTRAVLQRLHQSQFRVMVLSAYRQQCCICRLKHIELLDAAHILPDRHPKGEPVVTNGLGLCKIHHSAYDANIIGIDPDATVHVREDILHETDGPMLKYGLQAVAGYRLIVPRKGDLHPNRDFLAERYERFRAA
jgi:putative restriction endonuclease